MQFIKVLFEVPPEHRDHFEAVLFDCNIELRFTNA